MENVYIFADVETSGLSSKTDRVVSIAASCKGQEFSTLVDPQRRIPRAASAVHGLRDEHVRGQPTWAEVGPRFWAWVAAQAAGGRAVLVAHNGTFDRRMVCAEDSRLPQPPPRPPGLRLVDTLRVARRALPTLKSHRQCVVYEHLFGEQPEGQHDSLGDVRALARICEHPLFVGALARHAVAFDDVAVPKTTDRSVAVEPLASGVPCLRCERCSRVYSTHFRHECPPGI